MTRDLLMLLAAGCVLLAGCDRGKTPPAEDKPAAKATGNGEADLAAVREYVRSETGADTSHAHTHSHPPGDAAIHAPPGSEKSLEWSTPAGWEAQPLGSSMRVAQYRLERAEGDGEDAEVVVFSSAALGGGGDARSNIDRWRSQFTKAGGAPLAAEDAREEQMTVGDGISVTLIDMTGTYTAMMPSGMTGPPKENQRMVAAVVDFPGGTYYIRLTGPAATVTRPHDG